MKGIFDQKKISKEWNGEQVPLLKISVFGEKGDLYDCDVKTPRLGVPTWRMHTTKPENGQMKKEGIHRLKRRKKLRSTEGGEAEGNGGGYVCSCFHTTLKFRRKRKFASIIAGEGGRLGEIAVGRKRKAVKIGRIHPTKGGELIDKNPAAQRAKGKGEGK